MSNELPKEVIDKIYKMAKTKYRRFQNDQNDERASAYNSSILAIQGAAIESAEWALTDPEVLAMAGLVKKEEYNTLERLSELAYNKHLAIRNTLRSHLTALQSQHNQEVQRYKGRISELEYEDSFEKLQQRFDKFFTEETLESFQKWLDENKTLEERRRIVELFRSKVFVNQS